MHARERGGPQRLGVGPLDDDNVQALALQRQLLLQLHPPWRAGQAVGQADAEPAAQLMRGAMGMGMVP
jgi:hypothetical protein